MSNKWSKEFWVDLAERVGSTFVGALLATFALTEATPVDWSDAQAVWLVLGVPTLVSLLKGLSANLAGGQNADPTASVVKVDSMEPRTSPASVSRWQGSPTTS